MHLARRTYNNFHPSYIKFYHYYKAFLYLSLATFASSALSIFFVWKNIYNAQHTESERESITVTAEEQKEK